MSDNWYRYFGTIRKIHLPASDVRRGEIPTVHAQERELPYRKRAAIYRAALLVIR